MERTYRLSWDSQLPVIERKVHYSFGVSTLHAAPPIGGQSVKHTPHKRIPLPPVAVSLSISFIFLSIQISVLDSDRILALAAVARAAASVGRRCGHACGRKRTKPAVLQAFLVYSESFGLDGLGDELEELLRILVLA